jgi:hypothetical protein
MEKTVSIHINFYISGIVSCSSGELRISTKAIFFRKILRYSMFDRTKNQQKNESVIWTSKSKIMSVREHVSKFTVEYPTLIEYSLYKQKIVIGGH